MLYEKDQPYYEAIRKAKNLLGNEIVISVIDRFVSLNEDFISRNKEDQVIDVDEEYHKFLLKNKTKIRYEVSFNKPYTIHETDIHASLRCRSEKFNTIEEAIQFRENFIMELDFEDFCEVNEVELNIIFAERGSDREADFDLEDALIQMWEREFTQYPQLIIKK